MNASNLLRVLFVAVFLSVTHSAGAATISWGALATSSIIGCDETDCTVIDNTDAEGGSTSASALTLIDESRGISFAEATLSGGTLTPDALTPQLRVLADANSGANLITSSASGIQAYTNLDIARTITLDLLLTTGNGGVSGSPASVLATVSVFKSFVAPELTFTGDTFEDLIIDPVLLTGMSAPPLFALPGFTSPPTSFEFDVSVGEHFLILASLVAQAGDGGIADASSTLNIGLYEGNQALGPKELNIASQSMSVIPLPAGVWLFLTGVGLVAGLSRRRNTAAS